jgi:hypothetical protein
MKNRNIAIALSVIALGVAAWERPGQAQGPLWDRVNVTLPYTVTVGDKTLQPGDYVIQQLSSNSGSSRVLLIYSDQGMKFETSAITIPVLDKSTPDDTKVILNHYGPDYYFDKIWIQGKDYGYEFPLPDNVKAREKERAAAVSVAATYQSVENQNAGNQNSAKMNGSQASSTSTNTMSSSSSSNTAATQPQTGATPGSTSWPPNTATTQPQMSQSPATQPAQPAPATSSYPSSTSNTATTTQPSTTSSSADRAATQPSDTTREMPQTSAGWLMMLLSSGTLSGAGMVLRRKGVKNSR